MLVLGLFKLQELVKSRAAARTEMYIRQAGPDTYRQVLREIRQKDIYKLIVDTSEKHMHQFFRAVSIIFISTLACIQSIHSSCMYININERTVHVGKLSHR